MLRVNKYAVSVNVLKKWMILILLNYSENVISVTDYVFTGVTAANHRGGGIYVTVSFLPLNSC